MQSDEERSASGTGSAGSAAASSPNQELLYRETKWIVLNLLSCAPSAAGSPTGSSRPCTTGHGSQSPRALAAGVSFRLGGNLDGRELDVDGDAAEDIGMDARDSAPRSPDHRRHRASLTLDVRPVAGNADSIEVSGHSALQQVIEEEANAELSRLSAELRGVDVSSSPILTPQSETANILRVIGDRMNAHFTQQVESVAEDIVDASRHASNGDGGDPLLTFDVFQSGARRLISGSPERPAVNGWNAVALVLAYANRVTWNLLRRGHRSLGDVAEYTTQVLWDNAADFIVQQGGWAAMSPLASLIQQSSSGSSAPTPSSSDSVDGAASPQSPLRGTSIRQTGGYIRSTPDQRNAARDDASSRPQPATVDLVAPVKLQGGNTDAHPRRKASPEDNASGDYEVQVPLHCSGNSRCSSAAATLSSEMSLPMFSRTGSPDDEDLLPPLLDTGELNPATLSADHGGHRGRSTDVTDAPSSARSGSAASDTLCSQYIRALQDVQSDDEAGKSSTDSSPPATCRTALASCGSSKTVLQPSPWQTPPRPLSSSLPQLAPSPFGSVRDVRFSSHDGDGDELAGWCLPLRLGELSPSAFGSVRDLHLCTSSVSKQEMSTDAFPAGVAGLPAGSCRNAAVGSGRARRSMDIVLSDLPVLRRKQEGDVDVVANAAAAARASVPHQPSSDSSWRPQEQDRQHAEQPAIFSLPSHSTDIKAEKSTRLDARQSASDDTEWSCHEQTTQSSPVLPPTAAAAAVTAESAAAASGDYLVTTSAAAAEGFNESEAEVTAAKIRDNPTDDVFAELGVGRRTLYLSASRGSPELPAQWCAGAVAEPDDPSRVARAVGDSAVRLAAAAAVAVAAVAVSSAPGRRLSTRDARGRFVGKSSALVTADGAAAANTVSSQSDCFPEVDGYTMPAPAPACAPLASPTTIADPSALARVQCACGCPPLRSAAAASVLPCSMWSANELPSAPVSFATTAGAAAFADCLAGDACCTCTCSWQPAEMAIDESKSTVCLPEHTGDGHSIDKDSLTRGGSGSSSNGGSSRSSGCDSHGEHITSVFLAVADDAPVSRAPLRNDEQCLGVPLAVDKQLASASLYLASVTTADRERCNLAAADNEAGRDDVDGLITAKEAVVPCRSETTAGATASAQQPELLETSFPVSRDDSPWVLGKTDDDAASGSSRSTVAAAVSTGDTATAVESDVAAAMQNILAHGEEVATDATSGATIATQVETVAFLDVGPAGITNFVTVGDDSAAPAKSQDDAGLRLPDPAAIVLDKTTLLMKPAVADERSALAMAGDTLTVECLTASVTGDSLAPTASRCVEEPQRSRLQMKERVPRASACFSNIPTVSDEQNECRPTTEILAAPDPTCTIPLTAKSDNSDICADAASELRGRSCAAAAAFPVAVDVSATGWVRVVRSASAADVSAERSPQHSEATETSLNSSVPVAAASKSTAAASVAAPASAAVMSGRCEPSGDPQRAAPAATSRWSVIVGGVVVVVALACAAFIGRNRMLRS